jgi:hypothetical protein
MKGLLVVEYILRVIEGRPRHGDAALDLRDDVYERSTELDAAPAAWPMRSRGR